MHLILFLILFPPLVFCWSANSYWGRYSAQGINYNSDDAYNGMWSDDGNGNYVNSYWGRQCSGCSCHYISYWTRRLGTCSNSVSVTGYSITDPLTSANFTESTTSINIQGCSFQSIHADTFSHLSNLTSLTIQSSGLTFLPDLSRSKITKLNLIGNSITLDSRFNGTLPDTIQYLALTSNNIHWLPEGFIKGPNLRLVSLGYNSFISFPVDSLGLLPTIMYFGIEGNQVKYVSKRHLESFTTSTFVHLNISNNAVKYVESGALSQLPNLKILELHGNSIASIQRGVFENLNELLHLDLHHNKLETLTSEAFINMENLIEFRLHNQNPSMTTILFDSMINIGTSLKYFFISSNSLTHLPHQIFMEGNFTHLIELYADNNQIKNITELPESGYGLKLRQTHLQKQKNLKPFSTSPNIVKLYLQNNLVEMLNNTDLCELQSLQLLHLRSNKLNETHIEEDAFTCLPVLSYLDLGSNYNMQFVPIALTTHAKLPAVVTLYLDSNLISVLPSETFRNVTTLNNLYLQNNEIVAVENYTFPDQLQILYLHNNRIIAVEDDAFPAGIRTIYLYNNDFRFIHENQFSNLAQLTTLRLDNNAIDYIPDMAFINATSLSSLYLSSNKIPQIKKIHFQNCPLSTGLYLSSNEIGWIQDGSLSHMTSTGTLDLSNNRLYRIPMNGTFHDLSVTYLYLHSNRISIILNDTFKNLHTSYMYLYSNRISAVETGAFHTVTASNNLNINSNKIRVLNSYAFQTLSVGYFYLEGNFLGEVQPYTFNGVSCTYFYMRSMNLGRIESYTFNDLSCSRVYLDSTGITDISTHAFNNFRANDYLYLNNNQLTTLQSSIFGGSSYVDRFYLNNNGMKSIVSEAFQNVGVDYMYLYSNELTIYPAALNAVNPYEIHLQSNQITGIPTGSFTSQSRLQKLYMYSNSITQITARLFNGATSLQILDFHSNQIQQVEEDSFFGLNSLQSLDLGQNIIPYFPSVSLPSLITLDLADNRIETLGGLNLGSNSLSSVNLDNNFLGCECTTVQSLLSVHRALSSSTRCYSPTELEGTLFASSQSSNTLYYTKKEPSLFQCSGENIVGTTESSTNITISWTRPNYLYYTTNGSTEAIARAEIDTDNVNTWNYLVTCTSNTAATLTKSVVKKFQCPQITIETCNNTANNMTADNSTVVDFNITSDNTTIDNSTITDLNITTDNATIANLTVYDFNTTTNGTTVDNSTSTICNASTNVIVNSDSTECVNSTEHTASVSFTDIDGLRPLTLYECVIQLTVDNYTSAKSVPTFIYTAIPENATTEENTTVDAGITLQMIYYDFSVGHDDFSSTSALLSTSPSHVVSPQGSWLAISSDPTVDTFSGWFRSTTSNIEIKGEITMSHNTSNSSKDVKRYYSDSFFPVDSLGYGAEGQTDCTDTLHNFAFTSELRTGLKFSGTEIITVGGGEELWLFINKILVIEIIANRSSTVIPCQKVDLMSAGSGSVIPLLGSIVNGECVGFTSLTTSSVQLNLKAGETYLFEIFHTERKACTSELYIQLENVYLSVNENDIPPFDYEIVPREDLHVNGIAGSFNVWDVFSTGTSFPVELVSGNEARHFTLIDDTTANRNAGTTISPPTYEYTYNAGTNTSYVECPNSTFMISESYISGSQLYTITTSQILVRLESELDYEVAKAYTLTLTVIDSGVAATGSLIIRVNVQDVNDNCPNLLSDTYLTPKPILKTDPLFIVNITDLDSGDNSDVRMYIATIIPESTPVTSIDGRTELILEVVGVDQGIPPRGSAINITVNISNTCLVDKELQKTNFTFVSDDTTGGIYLIVPGYYAYNYSCTDYIGIYNGLIRDDLISASSSRSRLTLPNRARLGLNASDPFFGPLSGGWVAGSNDPHQYIEVNLEEPYTLKQIHLQGQQDEANWVTAFHLYYRENSTTNMTLYQDDLGEFIFLGNNDQDTIRTVDLNPPIYAQYVRINPRNWTNNIALRMEFSGCSETTRFNYETRCERCDASYYCLGDGLSHTCARCENETTPCNKSQTEFSFGGKSTCSACLDGWICKEGLGTPCDNNTYVLGCNDTYCPDNCTTCEPGYACRGGQRYICQKGTYSDGTTEYCSVCSQGTYQDELGQSDCKECPAGYFSSTGKDKCHPCTIDAYSLGDGSGGCVACTSEAECPCMSGTACFTSGENRAICINKGAGVYQCLDCPPGYTGDGRTCSDIDECGLYTPCWNETACVNTVPGYQCLACPRGYAGTYEDGLALNDTVRVFELRNEVLSPVQDQVCVDVDECQTNNGGCDSLSPCVNTIGSYHCGYCGEGYAGIPSISCYSTNYCQTGQHTCSQHATCTHLGPGEYSCECLAGFTGTGTFCGLDTDLDGHPDNTLPCTDWGCFRDNCRVIPNSGQEDADGDRIGDDCDDDSDNDGTTDVWDNCPFVHNWNRTDNDTDGIGDICDNCPFVNITDQTDTDGDGVGNVCDDDDDNDGVTDNTDNCPLHSNSAQTDTDSDGIGDVCDNCVTISNNNQQDSDQNGYGDSCDPTQNKDKDGDSILDINDNCPEAANGEQTDTDNDGTGDVCDSDLDDDGVLNYIDNCPYLSNALQTDINGDHVGDDCVVDSDGDGVDDGNDTCSYNKYRSTTSFNDFIAADLYPGYSSDPQWKVKGVGREIYQLADTSKPVMLIGQHVYGSIRYSGTFYVRSDNGDNYIGIVFGYVNNRKFYLLSWKPTNYNFSTTAFKTGVRGLNLKLVNSISGPGSTMANALWKSSTTTNEATVLWHDGNMTRWSNYTSYRWYLTHYTDSNRIRFQLYDFDAQLADSGDIYDTSITGGRVGVYQFGQDVVLWSDLNVQCLPRENKALYLDGTDDYIRVTNLSRLSIYRSFTVGLWVMLEDSAGQNPIFCTESRIICFWLDNGYIHGKYGNSSATSTSAIATNDWISLVYIYDESEYSLKLYADGTLVGQTNDISPIDMGNETTDTLLYIGKDDTQYFKGFIDEFVFYNIALLESEISDHVKLPSITKYPTLYKYGQLYYKMDHSIETLSLVDSGILGILATINGSPVLRESLQDYKRFRLEYPDG